MTTLSTLQSAVHRNSNAKPTPLDSESRAPRLPSKREKLQSPLCPTTICQKRKFDSLYIFLKAGFLNPS